MHEAFDSARIPVELDVLIDCDTVSEHTSCFEALNVLLAQHGIRTWRYSDHGPSADVRRKDHVPVGWVEVLELENDQTAVRRGPTHAARYSDGNAVSMSGMWGGINYSTNAESDSADLLGQAAESTRMGILVTNRAKLLYRRDSRWRAETLFARPERAVATLGLMLRSTGNFPVGPYSTTNRGSYLWLALDSLLPHYPEWAAACSADGVAGPGRIYYLSTATEGRLFQVLSARDHVAVAMSQSKIDWVDVADAVDRFLVFLLAAMDATARVIHEIVRPENMSPIGAKWQSKTFLEAVRTSNPSLAGLFSGSSPGRDVHLILRQLRNTVHGGGLTKTHVLVDDGDLKHKLSVPLDEVDDLADPVMRRTSGNPAHWGLRLTDERVWIQPIPLVDALTREGFGVLDAIFRHTPLETLSAVNVSAETGAEDVDYEPDRLERQNWASLDQMLATRETDMYLWHLGMHPDQLT